jgi:hypothetical protein
MLRLGPPQIVIFGVPFIEREPGSVGWVIRIGTGASTSTIPAMAEADTVDTVGPSRAINVVLTFRLTVTRMRAVGSVVDGEKLTPGTVVVAGKSTTTVSLAEPPKPFLLA